MRVKDFKEYRKNTLRGFFTLEIANAIEIKDCTLHQQGERAWFGFPGAAQVDKDGQLRKEGGRVLYKNVILIPDKTTLEKTQAKVIEELRAHLD